MEKRTRTKIEHRQFRSQSRAGEILAIEPQALDFSYLYTGVPPNERTEDNISIVTIHGPLEHHATEQWDSYESILFRVERAMSGFDVVDIGVTDKPIPPLAVVLRIDSPGGEAAGATFAHRKLRSLRKKYKIPLYAYANEMAASAAYEIACAADEIWLPDTGTIGSIGVIATLYDRTEQNKRTGFNIALVTSGENKADNHADRELTDDIRDRIQARVMKLANVFWSVVAKARNTTVDAVASLEAGVFIGQDAVSVGIADGVKSWGGFLKTVVTSVSSNDAAASPKGK